MHRGLLLVAGITATLYVYLAMNARRALLSKSRNSATTLRMPRSRYINFAPAAILRALASHLSPDDARRLGALGDVCLRLLQRKNECLKGELETLYEKISTSKKQDASVEAEFVRACNLMINREC